MTALAAPHPDAGHDGVEIDPHRLTRVASIHYYGRSGSIFLQSLLDSHPDVLMLPVVYLCGFHTFWSRYGGLRPAELVGAFAQHYEVLYDPTSTREVIDVGRGIGLIYNFNLMGEGHDERLGLDRAVFIDRLMRKAALCVGTDGRLSRKFFFQAVHAAYAEALGRRMRSESPLIVYQGHNPQFAQVEHLITDFSPHLKFVHCVREPVPALGSWFAHTRTSELGCALDLPYRVLGRAVDQAKPILNQWPVDGAKPPLVSWNERNTRAVRLEDLHNRPRETLEKLCDWLGIPWDDALLQSTFDGKLWHWPDGSRTLSGFQRRTLAKTHDDVISGFDRVKLRLLLADKYRAWDYRLPRWCRSAALAWLSIALWLVPFRMEATVWRRQDSCRSHASALRPPSTCASASRSSGGGAATAATPRRCSSFYSWAAEDDVALAGVLGDVTQALEMLHGAAVGVDPPVDLDQERGRPPARQGLTRPVDDLVLEAVDVGLDVRRYRQAMGDKCVDRHRHAALAEHRFERIEPGVGPLRGVHTGIEGVHRGAGREAVEVEVADLSFVRDRHAVGADAILRAVVEDILAQHRVVLGFGLERKDPRAARERRPHRVHADVGADIEHDVLGREPGDPLERPRLVVIGAVGAPFGRERRRAIDDPDALVFDECDRVKLLVLPDRRHIRAIGYERSVHRPTQPRKRASQMRVV